MGSQTATLPLFSATFTGWVAVNPSQTSLTPSSFRFQVPPHSKAAELNLLRFHRARTWATLDEKDPSPKTPLSVQESQPNRVYICVNFIVSELLPFCFSSPIDTCYSPVLHLLLPSLLERRHTLVHAKKMVSKKTFESYDKRAQLQYCNMVVLCLRPSFLSKRDHSVSGLGSI